MVSVGLCILSWIIANGISLLTDVLVLAVRTYPNVTTKQRVLPVFIRALCLPV
jgi:hypothetical protein